jgi:hypothetical protein
MRTVRTVRDDQGIRRTRTIVSGHLELMTESTSRTPREIRDSCRHFSETGVIRKAQIRMTFRLFHGMHCSTIAFSVETQAHVADFFSDERLLLKHHVAQSVEHQDAIESTEVYKDRCRDAMHCTIQWNLDSGATFQRNVVRVLGRTMSCTLGTFSIGMRTRLTPTAAS